MMGYLVHRPKLMKSTEKSVVTRFARKLEPKIICEYEKVTDDLFVIKIDFDKKKSYDLFIERFWGKQ
jgi:hypothetical protein